MATLTEINYNHSFIISNAPGELSFENITLITGQKLTSGTVLGKITASGKYTALAPGAGDGSQTAAAILVNDTDATSADKVCAGLLRGAEVNSAKLGWSGASGGQITTATGQLAALNPPIIIRTGI